MKNSILIVVLLCSVLGSGCCSKKGNESKTASGNDLYKNAWELEYISGPRIAFEGLYPEQKPYLLFTEKENQYSGNSSCNLFSGPFTLKNRTITFGDAIKTMRYCEGGGEETFLNMLGKVNKLTIDSDGKLLLQIDDVVMMRFKSIKKPQQ